MIRISVKDKKVLVGKNEIVNLFNNLEDGEYYFYLEKLNPNVSIKDYRKAYFKLVDNLSKETGNDKTTLHNLYKEEKNLSSTKNLTIEEWKSFLKDFSLWAFVSTNNMI